MAVNIASRLQSIAKEGEVLIDESTFQKISDQKIAEQIDVEALPHVKVKGIDEPMTVYRVNRVAIFFYPVDFTKQAS